VQDTVVLGEESRRWLGTPWMGAVTHALERAVRASYKARRPVTSFRQMEANRRNALRSTGPKSHYCKRQSRRNALRHGLAAETVIEGLEDTEDYTAFEAAIISDYDAQTAVQRELVLRFASLLWRLRQAEILRDRRNELAPSDHVTHDEIRLSCKRCVLIGTGVDLLLPQTRKSRQAAPIRSSFRF
jgi:hypothetical protein